MARPARLLATATATATLAAGLVGLAPPAQAAYCGITWGSTAEQAAATSSPTLVGVRSGQQSCYDRLVLDVGPGRVSGYSVRYVPTITQDGSGHVVPVRGGAALEVVVNAPAYDDAGHATYSPANPSELTNVTGYRTFQQVVWAGSFEGQGTVGVGVRARLPFRVFALPGPGAGSRLVVDVAHRW